MTNGSSLRWVCALLVLVVSLASVGCDHQYQPVDRQLGQFTTQQLQQLYVGNVGTQSAPTPSIGIFNALNGLNSVGSVQVEGPPMALV